jgi:hypothetical protein
VLDVFRLRQRDREAAVVARRAVGLGDEDDGLFGPPDAEGVVGDAPLGHVILPGAKSF